MFTTYQAKNRGRHRTTNEGNKVKGKNIFWMTLVTLLLTSLLMTGAVTSTPETEIRAPTIVDTEIGPGETRDVDITIVDVTNLYGWDVVLNFNPVVLEAIDVAMPTPNFLGPDSAWAIGWFQPVIDNFMGTVKAGDTLMTPLPPEGVSGTGTLVTITFEVKAENAISPLSLEPTGLYTYEAGWKMDIPHEAIDGVFDNRVTVLPPLPDFEYDPLVAINGMPVTFTSTSTDPDGGWIVNWYWEFGDGTNATGEVVDHTYAVDGVYTVTLNVTDNDGLTNDIAVDITVVDWLHGGTYPDLVGKAAWPQKRQLKEYWGDRTNELYAMVGNPTGDDAEAYVEFTLLSRDELRILGTLTTSTETIIAHKKKVLSATFDTYGNPQWSCVSGGDWWPSGYIVWLRKYLVQARCYTFRDGEWQPGNVVKDFQFKVSPASHDVALLSATPDATEVDSGEPVTIDMIVENQGVLSETFDVTLRHGEDVMVQTVVLDVGENTTVTFIWDSTGLSGQNAVLWAELPEPAVIYEKDFTDQREILVIRVN